MKERQPKARDFPDDVCLVCLVTLFVWVLETRKEKDDAEKDRTGYEVKTSLTYEHCSIMADPGLDLD